MEATKDELVFRQFRELQELRGRQKEEMEAWNQAHDPNWEAVVGRRSALSRAEAFLRAFLRDGGLPYATVVESSKKVGIGLTLLRRAKATLGVESYKISWNWYWRFPKPPIVSQPLTENPDPSVESQC